MTSPEYETGKSPKRRDGSNAALPWAVWRKGVIGGAGRSLVAKFKSKARVCRLVEQLNTGAVTEREVRDAARQETASGAPGQS